MNAKLKKVLIISFSLLFFIVLTVSIILAIRYYNDKAKIEDVSNTYSKDIQERIENNNVNTKDDLLIKYDGESVLGLIKIDKIGYEGLIYEGTSLETLSKGVGHFENSSYLEGNVCLAAHNTKKYWQKLHTLQIGDTITYMSFLGEKEYEVIKLTEISETDWSTLQDTDKNTLTLITCIKGKKSQRLCVQAIEKENNI